MAEVEQDRNKLSGVIVSRCLQLHPSFLNGLRHEIEFSFLNI
jgi:hypothetical protein